MYNHKQLTCVGIGVLDPDGQVNIDLSTPDGQVGRAIKVDSGLLEPQDRDQNCQQDHKDRNSNDLVQVSAYTGGGSAHPLRYDMMEHATSTRPSRTA